MAREPDWEDTLRIFDVATGEQLQEIALPAPFQWGLAFHPKNSSQVAIGTHKGVYVWNILNGGLIKHVKSTEKEYVKRIVYSPNGKLLAVALNEGAVRLPDNTITYIFEDKRGVLWLTRDNGISRAEINSPFTLYDGRLGLEGRAETIIHHKGKIYIGSTSGAFVLDNNTAYLKKINGINAQTWSFLEIDNQLLCATSDGLYQIDGYKASIIRESISQDFYAVDLMPSQQDPDILFVGLSTGFSILIKRNGKWDQEFEFPEIDAWVNGIVEAPSGIIWISTIADGVFRLEIPKEESRLMREDIKVSHFSLSQGLPEGEITIAKINEELFVSVLGDYVYTARLLMESGVA